MRRLLSIPMEQWIVRLLIEPHRPLVEAEALLIAAVTSAGDLATLAARMASPPWALLATLADEGFVTVHADGSMTVRADFAGIREPARLLAVIGQSERPRRVEATVYRDLCTGAWHPPASIEDLPPTPPHDEAHLLPAGVAPGDPSALGRVDELVRAAHWLLRRLKSARRAPC